MIKVRSVDTIDRQAEDVWGFAADILQHDRWMAIDNPRVLSGSSTEVGSRAREAIRNWPLRYDIEFEVVTAEPSRRLVWRSVSGAPFDLEVSLELEPLEDGSTRASYSGNLRLRGLWRLIRPLVAIEARRGNAAELRKLKQILETVPAVAT